MVYRRALPVLTTIGLGLGGCFVVFGRPSDSRGYSPTWWSWSYVALLVAARIAAVAVHAIDL